MIIIAFETSCDETSVALLKDKLILSNVTFSQVFKHKKYGGVLPSLAAKLHLGNIEKVIKKALVKSKISLDEIDYIAYTEKPGLIICLQIGKIMAEIFSLYLGKPLIKCNHLEGHVYASLLKKREWKFPALALVISGGHTDMYRIDRHCDFHFMGGTIDDAIGECLDKSALIMGYSYPGGPVIEKLALNGKDNYKLPLVKRDKSLDFSFSGLKSAIRLLVDREGKGLNINDLAYSIQFTLAKILVFKIKLALDKNRQINSFILGGGVIANKFLLNYLKDFVKKNYSHISFFSPNKLYCTDNAAMIAILAYYKISS